ncbi:hypothetical protein FHX76_002687 [Lysinibacter cavernae]|uniref:Uncharacterized protein n=1 Tax=Lysinibacter cavernae TaxID=1640652 RepID=A0A7X5R3A4_9MICO|nr:hypothetical protein [Lysinibacter cavernae]
MTKGCDQEDARWGVVRSALETAVRSGQVVVPLSAADYLELWHRHEQSSRGKVGVVMKEVSGYTALLPTHSVRHLEVQKLIAQLTDKPTAPSSTSDLLGHGATHAFNSPYGQFRFVESLASSDGTVKEGGGCAATQSFAYSCPQVVRGGNSFKLLGRRKSSKVKEPAERQSIGTERSI